MKVGKARAARALGAYLDENGIKRNGLSKKLGLDPQTLGFWVRGARKPGRRSQVQLARETGLDILKDGAAWRVDEASR